MRALRFVLAGIVALVLATGAFAGPAQPRANGGCYGGPNLPLDAGVAGITSAFGTCALSRNWLNRNFADVVANGVTYTIRFVNGAPDTKRLAQLMGNINPNSGTGALPLAKWYDQAGTSDCVQSTSAARMSVWLVNGVVSIAADGYFYKYLSGGTNRDLYCTTSAGSYNSQASTFFFAGMPFQMGAPAYNSGGAGTVFQTGSGCCSGAAGAGWNFFGAGSSGASSSFSSFSWYNFTGPSFPNLWPEASPVVLGAIFGASVVTFSQNEETPVSCTNGTTACPLPSQTATGLMIGADSQSGDAGAGAYVRFQAVLAFGATALSGGNQTTIRNSLYQLFKIPSAPSYSVINDGASYDSSEGGLIGGVNGYGWVEQMRQQIPYPIRLVNLAVPGATIADLTTAWNAMASYPCVGSYTKTILIGPSSAAGNSINGGKTGAQTYSDLQTYLTTVASKCTLDAIIVTTLAGGGEYANYTALVKANAVSLGITVDDWATSTVMGSNSSSNPVLFNQASPYTGHPTIAGYSWLAIPGISALRSAIGR